MPVGLTAKAKEDSVKNGGAGVGRAGDRESGLSGLSLRLSELSPWRVGLGLALLFGLLYFLDLGGAALHDYDEAAYAEVAREMVERDDYLRPHLGGEPWFEKPPALYWGMVAGFRLVGQSALGARLVDAGATLALIVAIYAMCLAPLGRRAALLAALVTGTQLAFMILARVATTDSQLALWLVLCLGAVHRASEAGSAARTRQWLAAAGAFAGLAVLTKGAIGYLLPGGAVLVWALLHGRVGRLVHPAGLVPAVAIALGIGLSWYVMLGWVAGTTFVEELFWEHHVGRFLDSKQGHGGSPFYYIPVLLVGCLPWSPFLILALWRLRAAGIFRGEDERARFLSLLVIFGALTLLFFSFAATKLPNYAFPVVAVAGILVADRLERSLQLRELDVGHRWSVRSSAALTALLGLVLVASPAIVPLIPVGRAAFKVPGLLYPIDLGAAPFVAGGVFLLAGLGAYRLASRERIIALVATLAGAFAFGSIALVMLALPRYDAHFRRPFIDLARHAAQLSRDQPFWLVGIRHAPSATFYSGQFTHYASPKDLENFFSKAPVVAITALPNLEKLEAVGALEVLERRKGYVLFRTEAEGAPISRDDTRTR